MELMYYMLQLLRETRHSNDESFEIYKELLLRHSVQRPPHSLAIFNLDDVKRIDNFTAESFYRHFDIYLYTLTPKHMLVLETQRMFTQKDQPLIKLDAAKIVPAREIEDLKQYFSRAEEDAIKREEEYMTKGPGRIERIMREEMEKL